VLGDDVLVGSYITTSWLLPNLHDRHVDPRRLAAETGKTASPGRAVPKPQRIAPRSGDSYLVAQPHVVGLRPRPTDPGRFAPVNMLAIADRPQCQDEL
jgi:hypothetical protein